MRFDSNSYRRWIWDFFRESCSLVEVDKAAASRRFTGRRKFKKNCVGMEAVTCEQRLRMGTKDGLILEFKPRKVFDKYVEGYSGFTIRDEVVGTMICDCIKPAAGNDYCCIYCFQPEIVHLLRGLKQAYDSTDPLSGQYAEGIKTTNNQPTNQPKRRTAEILFSYPPNVGLSMYIALGFWGYMLPLGRMLLGTPVCAKQHNIEASRIAA